MPITIGISFYNAEAHLENAIRSIFAQTYQDWELILIDDGSSDRSLEIAQSVRDSRIRVLSDGVNRRLSYRLNQITAEARYDLIGRMDADDLCSPKRFEKQLAVLTADPNVDLVTTGVCSITNDCRPVGYRCGSHLDDITGRKLLLGRSGIVHAAVLGRKHWFKRNRYHEGLVLAQDYELWLRAYSNNDLRMYVLGEPLYYYREEYNATSSKLRKAYCYQIELMIQYAHLGLSRYELKRAIATIRCKSAIVKALGLLNKTGLLVGKRNNRIADVALLTHFIEEIEMIRNTNLPK